MIVQTVETPILPRGHIRILRGNLAPDGAVAKITGKEGERFAGAGARCSTPKRTMLAGLEKGEIAKGSVVVIRYEGPKGGPGHAGDADADLRDHGRRARQGRRAAHRRPLLGRLARLHHRPHHARGAGRRPDRASCATAIASPSTPTPARCRVDVDDAELARRRAAWKAPAPKATSGVLGKYVRLVRSASEGCVTD